MSKNRELKNAQQALNEAVEDWALLAMWSHETPLLAAWMAFDKLRRDLDGPGAASARNTSINAGHACLPNKRTARLTVIQAVVANYAMFGVGMNVAELKARLRKEHSTISSAINFAEQHGWIKDSGQRKNTQYGKPAIVWEPTEMAINALRDNMTGAT